MVFEDYSKKLVLFPRDEEEMPAHNKAERGKKGAEEQKNNEYELLSLLTEMREDQKRRDEQLRKN